MYKRKVEARYNCCNGKAIIITYSECVAVALVSHHAMRMRLVLLPPVSCPALPYLSTSSHERHDFREKVAAYKMSVLISSTTVV